jgi:prolyl oligopeptidase
MAGYSWTRHHLLLTTLRDVTSRVEILTPGPDGWNRSGLGSIQPNQTISASAVDEDENDDYWLTVTGFLQPTALHSGAIGGDPPQALKSAPAFFDESAFTVAQHFAASKDGTTVPYFQVSPKDIPSNGRNPTLLSGYGGFEISRTPSYDGAVGRAWLERGGVLVVANIRGGGEYGPAWHQAALRGTSSPGRSRRQSIWGVLAAAMAACWWATCSPTTRSCSGRSSARFRCST